MVPIRRAASQLRGGLSTGFRNGRFVRSYSHLPCQGGTGWLPGWWAHQSEMRRLRRWKYTAATPTAAASTRAAANPSGGTSYAPRSTKKDGQRFEWLKPQLLGLCQ